MTQSPNSPAALSPAAGYSRLQVQSWREGTVAERDDFLAEETPVALIYNSQPHVVMMATPADLEEFAVGFTLSEAIVDRAEDITALSVVARDNGYEISLRIPEQRHATLSDRRRNLVGRSGCGFCGSETIAEALRPARHVPAGVSVAEHALQRALAALREQQAINAITGATHAAGWADRDGQLRIVREDIGRHNALDKLIGAVTSAKLDFARGFAVITSRASYEMVLKSATVGIPLLAAISAPTALAVRIAEEAGLTLVGFARGSNHVVYACPARLLHTQKQSKLEPHSA